MPLIHTNDVEATTRSKGSKFGSTFRRIGTAAGSKKLGCTMYTVDPGRSAFPFHAHMGEEEAIYILEGAGTLRIGDESHEVTAGHYAAFPVGLDHPHQLTNSSDGPLRYLCISTASDHEVVVYPDSNKVLALGGGWPPKLAHMGRVEDDVDYYDGEDHGDHQP